MEGFDVTGTLNTKTNCISEVDDLAAYLEGFANANRDEKLYRASQWLRKLRWNVCGAGFIGCHGGEKCTSDHK